MKCPCSISLLASLKFTAAIDGLPTAGALVLQFLYIHAGRMEIMATIQFCHGQGLG